MSGESFLSRVVAALEHAQIPYMVTGSFASSAHGIVRGSRDIDIVITATPRQLRAFIAEFPNDQYYADQEDALDALSHSSQFNIIDFGSTWKADLIFRKQRAFSRIEFERRLPHVIHGVRVYIASPEDILIAKLEWAKAGESERQIEDAAGVIATQGDSLDRAYVARWVQELDLQEQWRRALQAANSA
ncbi:MAG TPA: hypothetical protein VGR95_15440 [Thermoanaerobaculia bacterium]|jgi:hypothetical protein|nr:hypothetical protein [Thermoanaerobaculia bacterium]